jgi:hypothetical protein
VDGEAGKRLPGVPAASAEAENQNRTGRRTFSGTANQRRKSWAAFLGTGNHFPANREAVIDINNRLRDVPAAFAGIGRGARDTPRALADVDSGSHRAWLKLVASNNPPSATDRAREAKRSVVIYAPWVEAR